jgi:hypothetical protein
MDTPQVQPQPQVHPAPLPTTWFVQEGRNEEGDRWVVVTAVTPLGTLHHFMTPEEAKAVAAEIETVASKVQTGLIIPRPIVPPQL